MPEHNYFPLVLRKHVKHLTNTLLALGPHDDALNTIFGKVEFLKNIMFVIAVYNRGSLDSPEMIYTKIVCNPQCPREKFTLVSNFSSGDMATYQG